MQAMDSETKGNSALDFLLAWIQGSWLNLPHSAFQMSFWEIHDSMFPSRSRRCQSINYDYNLVHAHPECVLRMIFDDNVHVNDQCVHMADYLTSLQGISSNFCGTTVENFSRSLADGAVLCYLISNYLPKCLPHHAIKVTSSPTSDTLVSFQINVRVCLTIRSMVSRYACADEPRNLFMITSM